MADAFKKHGQVFTVPLFHRRVTFLIGPEVSPHFYKARAAGSAGRRAVATPAGARKRRLCASALPARHRASRRAGAAKPLACPKSAFRAGCPRPGPSARGVPRDAAAGGTQRWIPARGRCLGL